MSLRLSDIKTEFYKFRDDITRSCYRPRKVRYFNNVTRSYELMTVPCGQCRFCKNKHQDDWVTRMSLQSMTSKNTYFVTLTLAPEFIRSNKKYFDRHLSVYSDDGAALPLVLCKKDVQEFIKRLRFNTGYAFKYFASGEYGDSYSRPHYHLLLWSDFDISLDDVQKAWSINDQSIGRISFDNLRLNGTLSDLFRDSSSSDLNQSSKSCFKYVAKYCTKTYRNINNISTINLLRKYYEDHIKNKEFDLPFNKCNAQIGKYKYQCFEQFIECFKPFTICSTKSPIGIEFIEKSLSEWTNEVPNKIEMYGNVFQTPKIARKRWKDRLYPYRILSGDNVRPSAIGHVLDIYNQILSSAYSKILHPDDGLDSIDVSCSSSLDAQMYDITSKCYIQIDAFHNSVSFWRCVGRSTLFYSRSSTSQDLEPFRSFPYELVDEMTIADFLEVYKDRLVNYLAYLRNVDDSMSLARSQFKLQKSIFCDFNHLSSEDFDQLVNNTISDFENESERRLKKYLKRKTIKTRQLSYESD